jgi:hypothetical protein
MTDCFLVSIFLCTMAMSIKSPSTISYIDQNNNRYDLTHKSIHYTPVRVEHSSSGMYSGGNPYSGSIDEVQYNKNMDMAKKLLGITNTHSDDRVMTSSILKITEVDKTTEATLLPSHFREDFEKQLKSLMPSKTEKVK